MGMWGLSNQPAHHIPYLYAFTASPHKTQRITREALRRCFLGSEIGQGYPGDEDNGEMSAWYLFNALGFYPLCPGSPWYVLTAPLFEDVTVKLTSDRVLRVIAHRQTAQNVYIQHLTVNGQVWDSPFFPHHILAAGATLEFHLGPEPSSWGAGASLPDLALAIRRRADAPNSFFSFPGGEFLVDNTSDTESVIPPGGSVEWRHDRPTHARQYTLTAGGQSATAAPSWRFEASTDCDTWRLLDERRGEHFSWPRQLRPFTPPDSAPALAHRVIFPTGGCLSEIELLVDVI